MTVPPRDAQPSFHNLYTHGFARVAVAVPVCRVADPAFNAQQTIALHHQAAAQGAVLVAFPELGLSAYSCDDLFHQRALLDGCERALAAVVAASIGIHAVAVVGLPLQVDHALFNVAAVVLDGRLLGVVPKTFLPNYREYYEKRWFAPGGEARGAVKIGDDKVADFRLDVAPTDGVVIRSGKRGFAKLKLET